MRGRSRSRRPVGYKDGIRYFARLNGNEPAGLTRFDPENLVTWYFDWRSQEWVEDEDEMDIDVVTGRDSNAREVDEAEAERIRREILTPDSLE